MPTLSDPFGWLPCDEPDDDPLAILARIERGLAEHHAALAALAGRIEERLIQLERRLSIPPVEVAIGEGWRCGGCNSWVPSGRNGGVHRCKPLATVTW